MKDTLPLNIPIFPLNGVILFPGSILPLNIFEGRYKNMIEDVIKTDDRVLGIIQPKGSKKDKDNTYYEVGCAGKLIKFEELDDKRYIVSLKGISRFISNNEMVSDRGYLISEVDYKIFDKDFNMIEDKDDFIHKNDIKLKYALKNYFKSKKIESDWQSIDKCKNIDLVNQIAMICPFNSLEKQMLLEAKNLEDRYILLTSILESNVINDGNVKNVKH